MAKRGLRELEEELKQALFNSANRVVQSKPVKTYNKVINKITAPDTPIGYLASRPVELGKSIGKAALYDTANTPKGKTTFFKEVGRTIKNPYMKDVVSGSAEIGTLLAGGKNPVNTLRSLAGLTAIDTASSFGYGLGKDIGRSVTEDTKGKKLSETKTELSGVPKRIVKNIPRASLYGYTNAWGDSIADKIGGGRITKNLITGAMNVGEDYATYAMGVTDKPTLKSNVEAVATPALLDLASNGKITKKDFQDFAGKFKDETGSARLFPVSNYQTLSDMIRNGEARYDAKSGMVKVIRGGDYVNIGTLPKKWVPKDILDNGGKTSEFGKLLQGEKGSANLFAPIGKQDPLIQEARKYKSAEELNPFKFKKASDYIEAARKRGVEGTDEQLADIWWEAAPNKARELFPRLYEDRLTGSNLNYRELHEKALRFDNFDDFKSSLHPDAYYGIGTGMQKDTTVLKEIFNNVSEKMGKLDNGRFMINPETGTFIRPEVKRGIEDFAHQGDFMQYEKQVLGKAENFDDFVRGTVKNGELNIYFDPDKTLPFTDKQRLEKIVVAVNKLLETGNIVPDTKIKIGLESAVTKGKYLGELSDAKTVSQLTDIWNKANGGILKGEGGSANFFAKIGEEEPKSFYEDSGLAAKGKEQDLKDFQELVKRDPDSVLIKAVQEKYPDDPRFQIAPTEPVTPINQGEERGFITTLKESPNTPEQLRNEIEGTYKVKTNDETITRAMGNVKKDYLGTYNKLLNPSTDFTPESVAEAHILIKDLSDAGNFKAAANVAESIATKGTRAGQVVQAFSIWNRLTPEGMLVYAQKAVGEANDQRGFVDRMFGKQANLSEEDSKQIIDIMTKAQDLPLEERGPYARQAMEIINKAIPPSASELFDRYRYENMLSNPRTQLRNIFGNMMQTWVYRPMQMAFEAPYDWMKSTLTGEERQRYVSDVPKYYKDAINAIPTGAEAFTSSMRGESVIEQPDLAKMRRSSQAGPISRFMEGMDKFNQTIIGSAVKNDLMSKGMDENEARIESEKIARYWLFRQQADPSNKSGQGYLLSSIDKLSSGVAQLPGRKWMVPFIQTPTNVAKQWIEFSPAGFATLPGNEDKVGQLSKATLGSVVMLVAAKLAAEGKLTWAAPTTPEEKAIYYETRKPFSIKVGNKWVPMQYLGPFAAAFAVPAAYEYFDKIEKNSLSSTQAEKAYKTLQQAFQFMTNQTFLTGLNNYIQILSGDPDYNFESSVGFTATQVVPYSGFLKYVSQIVDPIMRKNKTFMDSFYQTIPGLSSKSYPYVSPTGEEIRREPINYVIPYDIKTPNENPAYEKMYQYNITSGQAGVFRNYGTRVKNIMSDRTLSEQEKKDRIEAEKEKLNRAIINLRERNNE